jgi:hypothetical protein
MKVSLIVIFTLLILSITLNRVLFLNFVKTNNLSSNPEQSKRWINIGDIASYYRKLGSLSEHQNSVLKKFELWEAMNVLSIPLIFILAVIGALVSSS